MNIKCLFITAGAIFVFALFWNGLVHPIVLANANSALAVITKPAVERSFGLIEFCVYGTLATLLYPIKQNT